MKKEKKQVSLKTNAGAKRSIPEREEDLVFIAKAYLKGISLEEVTELVNEKNRGAYTISSATVRNDVQELIKRYKEESEQVIDKYVGIQLQKFDLLESEYWAAYERSKQRKGSVGDITILDSIQKLFDQRTKLMGLDSYLKLIAMEKLKKLEEEKEKALGKSKDTESIPALVIQQVEQK